MLGPIVILLVGAVIAVQWWGVSRYLKWFTSFQLPQVNDLTLPKAAIILSIRGAAPCLPECLTRLAEQNYPQYRIHLVVDHPTDPANEIIGNWLETKPRRPVSISFLEDPSPNAYLKTSAILQAIRTLPVDVEVAVLADADTLTYPDWLKDLVIPLQSKDVGLVCGNRWYDPTANSWGSLSRFIYNAISVVPMYFMRATWEGSLSISREVFDTEFFRGKMKDTSSEAAAIQAAAKDANRRLELQPNVMIFNREPCSLASAFDFIKRQLLWTRLYHHDWYLLLSGTWAVHFLLVGALLSGAYYLSTGSIGVGATLLATVAAEILISLHLAEKLHKAISCRILNGQGLRLPAIDWPARLRLTLALPIGFVLTSYAMLAAALSRQVTWSGITYEVIPPHSLRMMEYVPLQDSHDKTVQELTANSIETPEPDPLIPPLRDNQFLIDLMAEISGKGRDEVTHRFAQEHRDLGGNVRRALAAAVIEPFVWSEALDKFYKDTDAFLYESLVWNRSSLKNDMRKWIGDYLARRSPEPLRVLSFGDGLGIDAYYLAQRGHDVTYFDVSECCGKFARRIFERGNVEVTTLSSPEQLQADFYDVVLCLDVLEHVAEPSKLVGWLSTVLRDNGELLVHAPFHYIDADVSTHLRSNQCFSGDMQSLYQPHKLHVVAGRLFWNPLVLRKFPEPNSHVPRIPWQVRVGSAILKIGSVWCWPHVVITKLLIGKQELIAMAESESHNDSST